MRTTTEERWDEVRNAKRVHVAETCWSNAIGNHTMGGEVESDDLCVWRRCEDPGPLENVGVVGDSQKKL